MNFTWCKFQNQVFRHVYILDNSLEEQNVVCVGDILLFVHVYAVSSEAFPGSVTMLYSWQILFVQTLNLRVAQVFLCSLCPASANNTDIFQVRMYN